ncbi:MAG: TetR/AcrR family transcriptional regulator [Streptococcaceae bacterium]|nr:TetR/AcrR family transcriptional regulator [Streptococcaceae bacterium]
MKIDLRVVKTKKAIWDAFFVIAAEKGVEAVTVQDIAKVAMINRATFYAHYKDKEDLFESIIDEFIEKFTTVIDGEMILIKRVLQMKKIEILLTRFYKEIDRDPAWAKILLEGGSAEFIQRKFGAALREKYQAIFDSLEVKDNVTHVPIEFIIEYMTGIFLSTLRWWVNDSKKEMTAEDMSQLIVKLIGNGHLTVIGLNVFYS